MKIQGKYRPRRFSLFRHFLGLENTKISLSQFLSVIHGTAYVFAILADEMISRRIGNETAMRTLLKGFTRICFWSFCFWVFKSLDQLLNYATDPFTRICFWSFCFWVFKSLDQLLNYATDHFQTIPKLRECTLHKKKTRKKCQYFLPFGQKWSFEITEILLIAKILSLAWTNKILFPGFIFIEISESYLRFDRIFSI